MSMPVAGELARVERFTEEECRSHFGRIFGAENGVLCIAGPVEEEAMLDAAAKAFAHMPRGQRLPEIAPPTPGRKLPIQVHATDDSQVSVLFTYPAPHENHPDFAALLLIRRILDDGFGSRLRQAICEQRGLAYSLCVSVDAYGDAGLLDLELSCAPKKMVSAVEEVERTLDALMAKAIGDEELARAKTRHVADLEFALDDPAEISSWHGAAQLIGAGGVGERLREVMAVSPDDLHRVVKSLFDRDAQLLTLMGPTRPKEIARLEKALGKTADGPAAELRAVG